MCSRWSRSPLKGFDTKTSRELRLRNDANRRGRRLRRPADYDWETAGRRGRRPLQGERRHRGTALQGETAGERSSPLRTVALQPVGDGVPAPLCGVLPMVALTPKGVRYPGLSAKYDKETMGDMLARQARYTQCVRCNRRMAIAICCKFCEFATRVSAGDS